MSHGVNISCQADFLELETDPNIEMEPILGIEQNRYSFKISQKFKFQSQANEKLNRNFSKRRSGSIHNKLDRLKLVDEGITTKDIGVSGLNYFSKKTIEKSNPSFLPKITPKRQISKIYRIGKLEPLIHSPCREMPQQKINTNSRRKYSYLVISNFGVCDKLNESNDLIF